MTSSLKSPSGLVAIANREMKISELIRSGEKSRRECEAELAELHAAGEQLIAAQDKRWAAAK